MSTPTHDHDDLSLHEALEALRAYDIARSVEVSSPGVGNASDDFDRVDQPSPTCNRRRRSPLTFPSGRTGGTLRNLGVGIRQRPRLAAVVAGFALAPMFVGAIVLNQSDSDVIELDTLRSSAVVTSTRTSQGKTSVASMISSKESIAASQDFRPDADGFSFANYAGAPKGDRFDATMMSALFSKEAVCVDPSKGTCTMLPAAKKVADQLNAAIASGRCEGMAVLAQRFFDQLERRPNSANLTSALKLSDVERSVGFWWGTQLAPDAKKEADKFRKMRPAQLVTALERGLKAGAGYTLGMYFKEGGHSVTPIAVTTEGRNKIIYIYDNNFPNQIGKILVDTQKQSWSYANGALNSSGRATTWSGTGAGSLDLTPMSARKAPFKVSFGSTRGIKAQAYYVLVTQDSAEPTPVGVRVRTRIDGKDIDVNTLDPEQVANSPLDVRNLMGEMTYGSGVVLQIPVVLGTDGELEIEVIGDGSMGAISMTVLRTGTAAVSIESESTFTLELITEAFSTDALVTFDDPTKEGTVMVANGPRASEIVISDGLEVGFTTRFSDDDAAPDAGTRRIEDPLPEFEIRNSIGEVVFKGTVASGDGGQIERITYDAATGGFTVEVIDLIEEELDLEFVSNPEGDPVDDELDLGVLRAAAPEPTIDELDLDNLLGTASTEEPAEDTTPATPSASPPPATTAPADPPATTTTDPPATTPAPETTVPPATTTPPTTTLPPPPPPPAPTTTLPPSPPPPDPIEITITAYSGTKVFGDEDPTVSAFTVTGGPLRTGDVVNCPDHRRQDGDEVGIYWTTVSANPNGENKECTITDSEGGDVTSQYQITTNPGTFEITPRPITVYAKDDKKWEDEEDPMFFFTATGLLEGHTVTCTVERTDSADNTLDKHDTIEASDCKITEFIDDEDPIDHSNNYTVTYVNGTLTIHPVRIDANPQPSWSGNNHPDSWGEDCTKIDMTDPKPTFWIAPGNYSLVVLKASTWDYVFLDVNKYDKLVLPANTISHIIRCMGGDINETGKPEHSKGRGNSSTTTQTLSVSAATEPEEPAPNLEEAPVE